MSADFRFAVLLFFNVWLMDAPAFIV